MTVGAQYTNKELEDLLDGKLSADTVHKMLSSFKAPGRFDQIIEILSRRVPWDDTILLPYGLHLYIVQKRDGERVVKCDCGHEFGDYRENWKTNALISVRDDEEKLGEIYPGPRSPDPEKNEIREFYCPSCGRQLEVDAVPPGYPILANFTPNLEAFYRDWLGRELP